MVIGRASAGTAITDCSADERGTEASELVMQVNARVMGVVLNAFNLRSADGYYYYYFSKYASRYYQQSQEEQKLGASAS